MRFRLDCTQLAMEWFGPPLDFRPWQSLDRPWNCMDFGYVKCKVLHIMSLGQPWLASHLEGLGEATALLICALYQRVIRT